MARRTPKPAVHTHIPANNPMVYRESGPAPAKQNPSLISGWPGAITLTAPSTAPGQPPLPPASQAEVQGAAAKPGPRPPRRKRTGDEA